MTESVRSEIEIEAPASVILAVLRDFRAYPEWAAQVASAKVLGRDPDGRADTVEFEVTPGPLPRMRYVLHYTHQPDGLSWDYVEGDLKDMRGSYTLTETTGRTHVAYDLAIDPGVIPLPGFVKARAAREITRIALEELKLRVEAG